MKKFVMVLVIVVLMCGVVSGIDSQCKPYPAQALKCVGLDPTYYCNALGIASLCTGTCLPNMGCVATGTNPTPAAGSPTNIITLPPLPLLPTGGFMPTFPLIPGATTPPAEDAKKKCWDEVQRRGISSWVDTTTNERVFLTSLLSARIVNGKPVCSFQGSDGRTYSLDDIGRQTDYGLSRAQKSIQQGSQLTHLFGWDDNLEDIGLKDFFSETELGAFLSGNWEDSLCSTWVDTPSSDQGVLFTEGLAPQMAMHIEGVRTTYPIINETTGVEKTEYLYKVTYAVYGGTAATDTEHPYNRLEFNIVFEGEKTMRYYNEYWKIGGLDTVDGKIVDLPSSASRSGYNPIIELSEVRYDRVCIEYLQYGDWNLPGNRMCNTLEKAEDAPLIEELRINSATGQPETSDTDYVPPTTRTI